MLSLSLLVLVAAPQAQAANVKLDGMRTTLTTDTGTTSALFGAGIIPLPIAPSSVTPTSDAARYTFPVTARQGRRHDARRLHPHSGGILLAQRSTAWAWTALSLAKFADPHHRRSVPHRDRQRRPDGLDIADLDLGSAEIKTFTKERPYVP